MKIKKLHITIILLALLTTTQAQIIIDKDTSYTVNSTYKKYIKKFPQIEIVKPKYFENVIEKKDVLYKEIGTRKLYLDAFYHKSENLKPAVILLHGGGWKSGDKSMLIPMAQYIANKGYACFTVEYRLSTEASFPASIFDVKKAIKYVKENAKVYNIDTAKVAVLGCSSGGQMTALIGTTNYNHNFEDKDDTLKHTSAVQAIIDIDGVLAFKHPDSQEGEVASLWLGGSFEEEPNIWNQASALTYIDKNTPPILLIGSQYPRFLAGKKEAIEILNNYEIYNQVEIFQDSPHSFWLFHPWFNDTINYITTFLNKTLIKN
ncbi:MAG: alpha/beta hydrolase [Flavobacteriaceae bacterium]|nr:alpha/beta hydrolase [Flavobacteriaceae bacterium]